MNKRSTAEFQLLTMIDRCSSKVNELKMMGPLFFSDNTTSKLPTPCTFHIFMELKKSWTVILLAAIDRSKRQCEASLYVIATTHEIFSIGFKTILN